jgi:scytalone dehydratase
MNGPKATTRRIGRDFRSVLPQISTYVVSDGALSTLLMITQLDYRAIMPQGQVWEAVPADKFVAMISSQSFLGEAKLKTQHLVGATKWSILDGDHVISHSQMRVAHQKYADNSLKEVAFKGHAHGNCKVHYKLVDGTWKLAGLEPGVWWTEYNYEKFFEEKLD